MSLSLSGRFHKILGHSHRWPLFSRCCVARGPSDFHLFLMGSRFLLLVREGCGRALNAGFLGASSYVIPIFLTVPLCFVNIYG